MTIHYEVLIEGNSLAFTQGFFGFSSVVLLQSDFFGNMLFDCGHHLNRPMLLEALQQNNLQIVNINHVFLSHLHFDHANNVDMFPQAKIHVSRVEWQRAMSMSDDDTLYSRSINTYLAEHSLNLLDESEAELFPGLYFRHAPGHTAGSYLLYFDDLDGQRVVLAGDACKTYRELANARSVNEFDSEKRGSDTLDWIADHADVIVPGHFASLYKARHGWTWRGNTHLGLLVR